MDLQGDVIYIIPSIHQITPHPPPHLTLLEWKNVKVSQ